ncbi:hypothetical protein OG204_18800 [Streptomyces sp. NBC_01387]|uniref:hypothetical protein n=1 Tax=Streptomyces sp. NBC_01387 TaxID=2903849 RepID=UPI00324AB415
MIETAVVARAVSEYMHRCPGESLALAPLWQTLKQHAKAGTCNHRGTCPIVTASPIVVNESHEVLMLRGGRSPARLPEARLTDGFATLSEAAFNLARALGVERMWTQPGCEDPIQLDTARADVQDGDRMRVAVRYLVRTQAALCHFAPGAPQVWIPLAQVDIELARRAGAFMVEKVS